MKKHSPAPPAEPQEELLTTREVAGLYKINEKLVFKFIKSGKIPRPLCNWAGKGNRWLKSDIIGHMRSLRGDAIAA